MNFEQQYLYWIAGIILIFVSIRSFKDTNNPRRITTGIFWGIYGFIFLIGPWTYSLSMNIFNQTEEQAKEFIHIFIGFLVVGMGLLAGLGGVKLGKYPDISEENRQKSLTKNGNKIFIPALLIPIGTVLGVLLFKIEGLNQFVFGTNSNPTLITLFSMAVGSLSGLAIALVYTKEKPTQVIEETRRLLDSIGWAFILPQILATLGLLFTNAGVGDAIARLTETYLAVDNKFIAVVIYVLGMAILTMIMGNAFAAFPIVTAGVGIPILLIQHEGNPAIMAAIGMFSGYCGTLMTPMAANFNIVPAALLELKDKNLVIKTQIPTAVPLLIVNIFLMYFLMFKF
ncbi:DUF979 domain-containing protein [Thorsellia kenyensis]|uniref:DUF979 domain-containing protein n=1 Tax=Thorsellia kenyensis TaxID=1549888 RepID=A0ABV6CCQ9_9GAMM